MASGQRSFLPSFKYEWILHSTEVPFEFVALVHKLVMKISDRQELFKALSRYSCRLLCGDANKDASNMNFQLGKERWAGQAMADC